MKTKAQLTYIDLYFETQELIKKIQDKIHDMPAPDEEDDTKINWGNVGDMGRIVNELKEILI